MKIQSKTLIYFLIALSLSACDSWLDDAEAPKNNVGYDDMNYPDAFGEINDSGEFVPGPNVTATLYAGAQFYADLLPYSAAMSDEQEWVDGGNSLIYKDLFEDNITSSNSSIESIWAKAHNYRARSQELITRIGQTNWNNTEEHNDVKKNALWYGNLHAANAYSCLVNFFNDNGSEAGNIHLEGKSVPHSEILNLAYDAFDEALTYANEEQKAITNTLLARLALQHEDWAKASKAVKSGMQTTNEALTFTYSDGILASGIGSVAGAYGRELTVPAWFEALLTDKSRKVRYPLVKHSSDDRMAQGVYGEFDPAIVTDFAETKLIEAELAVRGHLSDTDAVSAVNEVINHFDTTGESAIEQSTQLTMDDIETYRRIYLSLRALRTLDLRRLNKDGDGPTPFGKREWKWFPVPDIETRN
ncbi:hypothetical protein FUAX_21870 [Fulvitalea axinellae]|uniref:RagB/SusD family nutrient uptake outer membrane protein n=1 Tax=Fulvitalea axinellae TaxID=1182444 RepID=A0AAU9CKD4_9BACT|nr:hypothetical protein FUAX_21870 [Fulvitalea axinellae]